MHATNRLTFMTTPKHRGIVKADTILLTPPQPPVQLEMYCWNDSNASIKTAPPNDVVIMPQPLLLGGGRGNSA